jgi:hypothetical protein
MQIAQIALPKNSLIEKSLPKIDYADCFSCQFTSIRPIQLESMVRFFLNSQTWWSKNLMRLRNILVKPFGLKTDSEVQPIINFSKGKMAGFFKVLEINDEEVHLLASDNHLDACLSIIMNKINNHYEVSISTTVYFRNKLGHVYFFFIKPFHKLIVKSMLSRMANHFSANQ